MKSKNIPTFVKILIMSKKNIVDIRINKNNIGRPTNPDLFNIHINTISKYKPLTREQEIELFKKLKRSKNPAPIRDKICRHNMLFVVSVAKFYSRNMYHSIVSLEDLVCEGNVGLCNAIDRFDYKSGNKFISYAVWHIRQQILKSIQDNIKNVRVPNNKQALNKWVQKQMLLLEQQEQRELYVEEVYGLAVKKKKINKKNKMFDFVSSCSIPQLEVSLSKPTSDDSESTLLDIMSSSDNTPIEDVHGAEVKENLNKMLEKNSSNHT